MRKSGFVFGVFLALLVVIGTGCMRITDENGNRVSLRQGEQGLSGLVEAAPVTVDQLRALVKGSVYETGEFVSVFGTCLNSTDGGYPGSSATMSSWYPNGTVFFDNVSMQQLSTGYFLYTGNMSAVQGTYLTELQCHINTSDQVAKAFGEWQNPVWVARISGINISLVNITDALDNLSSTVNQGFNITWEKIDNITVLINESNSNLTNLILYAASVANSSVDRNDSYLAGLLQQIIASIGVPVTQNLTVVESAQDPVYFMDWTINVTVINEYNVTAGAPEVGCFINTTNVPATVDGVMTWDSSNDQFTYSEVVRTLGDFSWSVGCSYN